VSTLCGSSTNGFADGDSQSARFYNESGLCTDTNGNIYVADFGNNSIRKIAAGIGRAPALQIALQNSRVVLSWPRWAYTFVLEKGNTLSSNTIWTSVTSGVVTNTSGFAFTNAVDSSAAFYRLRHL
jgi:hypothetical protein